MPTLEWIGKDKVINHHQEVPFRILDKKYTYNADSSENMIIHGDNLLALKSLLPQYEGRVDCIYIDPPYNTGNEKWVYNDNVNDPKIKKWLGEVVGAEGEDLSRHDKWLCMMYPRLKLIEKLLSNTGVVFISIDEHEINHLLSICTEIFGSFNVESLVWMKTDSKADRNTNAKIINRTKSIHEYIVVCYKNKKVTQFKKMMKLPSWSHDGKNPDNDPRGPWQSGIISFEEGHKKEDKNSEYYYTITTPSGKTYTRMWYVLKEEWDKLVEDNRISFPKNGDGVPRLKTFQYEEKEYYMDSILTGVGTSSSAKDEIEKIFGDRTLFDTPKPQKLIKELLRVSSKKTSIILDSFAGSGTTAHAVLDLNKQDGGNRKFILVEMMDYADAITAERVKRVIDGYGEGNKAVEGLGGDFSYYELGAPLFKEDKNLNEEVGEEEIRKYVYYMETKKPIETNSTDNRYYMGKNNDTAYYFYYEKDKPTTLNREFLATVKTEATGYVIYADICALSKETLSENGIVFKKIPRDIKRL